MIRLEVKDYNTNQEKSRRISNFSSRKIDKCKYLTAEKILLPDQSRIVE